MDVLFFLKERTDFIRHFYDTAAAPFLEIKRQIDVGEPPFEPPYSEDPEPPFMEEWSKADSALDILGRSCVSMASDSLKLYFVTWERCLWVHPPPCVKCFKKAFEEGFLSGYKACFGEALQLDWSQCPADLALLEQVILARNSSQHPQALSALHVTHDKKTLTKHPRPFFAHASEIDDAYGHDSELTSRLLSPSVYVSREGLFEALQNLDHFAEWLEEHLQNFRYRRH